MGYDWRPGQKKPINRRHKYNVDQNLSKLAGAPNGSKLERAVHQVLKLRESAGEIFDIKQQVRVDLGYGIYWNVDFSYQQVVTRIKGIIEESEKVWVEAKGVKCGRYRICLKLWKGGCGPGKLEIWEGSYQSPILKDIVIPNKSKRGLHE